MVLLRWMDPQHCLIPSLWPWPWHRHGAGEVRSEGEKEVTHAQQVTLSWEGQWEGDKSQAQPQSSLQGGLWRWPLGPGPTDPPLFPAVDGGLQPAAGQSPSLPPGPRSAITGRRPCVLLLGA